MCGYITVDSAFRDSRWSRAWDKYEGRSINKLQNGAIPLILKIGKIQNLHFVGNLIVNIQKRNSLDHDVIIVTSSGHRTVYLCIIHFTSFLS